MEIERHSLNIVSTQKRVARASRPVHFGLTDLLFSRQRKAWVIGDFFLTFLLFNIGIWNSPFGRWGYWEQPYIVAGLCFSIWFCFVGTGIGYYDRIRRFSISNMVIGGLFVTFIATMAAIGSLYFFYYGVFGRWTFLYGALCAYLVTILIRLPLRWVLSQFPYRFTIFGDSVVLSEIENYINSKRRDSRLYNLMRWDQLFPLGKPIDVSRLIQFKVGDIVVARSMNDPVIVDLALHAIHAGCRVIDEIAFYGHLFERVPIDQVSKSWLLSEGLDHRRRIFSDIIKRSFDFVAAFFGIILAFPLLVFIALCIKISSKGPVIFVQSRVGRFCEPFNMYKFRTMFTPGTGQDHVKQGFTAVNDPRVTWIGKIIRPLHFDELPQLFNILLGDMSIVGPRPEDIHFASRVRKELPLYDMRYLMRPGLTGHAQLNQGYAMDTVADTKKKLSYDLYYLCNHSLTWDLRLVLKTVFVLAKGAR